MVETVRIKNVITFKRKEEDARGDAPRLLDATLSHFEEQVLEASANDRER